jgi:hypothetical protein
MEVIITRPQSKAYREGFDRAWPAEKPHDPDAPEHRVTEIFAGFSRCSCGALTHTDTRVINRKAGKTT